MSRTAVVTGGASGMGLAIVERLARRGDRVAMLDRDAGTAERAAEKLGADGLDVIGVGADVGDRPSVDTAIDAVRDRFGPIGIMITSAGIDGHTPFVDIQLEEWERILLVNLTGTFHCIQAVVPEMITAGWGRIVTISSSGAQSGAPEMAHYVASKGGVFGLTKALAVELGQYGITVNSVPPRAIDTPMLRSSPRFRDAPEAGLAAVGQRMPVGRAGLPEDIAAACDFLSSEDAGYISGQILGVNGGGYI